MRTAAELMKIQALEDARKAAFEANKTAHYDRMHQAEGYHAMTAYMDVNAALSSAGYALDRARNADTPAGYADGIKTAAGDIERARHLLRVWGAGQ